MAVTGQIPQQEPHPHQGQRHQPDGPVGHRHDLAPVKAVGHRPGEKGEDALGQQGGHGGQGQDGG